MSLNRIGRCLSFCKGHGSQVERVRLAVRRGGDPRRLALEQGDLQRLYDGAGDAVLYLENVVEVPVVGFRPQVIAIIRTHELDGHSHVSAGFANAAFQYMRDHEPAGYRGDVLRLTLEVEGRCARR